MLKSRTFHAEGAPIHYVESEGDGSPLVLLPGGGNRWQALMPLIPALSLRWKTYALDWRGCGASGHLPGTYYPRHFASDVEMFLRDIVGSPAILFGHSLGGWVALMMATALPQKVRAVVLGDPPLDFEYFCTWATGPITSFWADTQEIASADLSLCDLAARLAELPLPGQDPSSRYGDAVDAISLLSMAKDLASMDPTLLDPLLHHVEEYVGDVPLGEVLRGAQCPVLLVQADREAGGFNADSDVTRALSLLPRGSSVKLEGEGHFLGLDSWNVAPLLRSIVGFAESLLNAAAAPSSS